MVKTLCFHYWGLGLDLWLGNSDPHMMCSAANKLLKIIANAGDVGSIPELGRSLEEEMAT